MICVITVRQSGHLVLHHSGHSLQAIKCLHGSDNVFRSWSVQIIHCMRCCRLAIGLSVCCCRSSGGLFEKYCKILLNISLVKLRYCKRMRVFPGLMSCPSSQRRRSVLKHRICSCKNWWYVVYRGDLSVFYCKVLLTEKFSFPICDVWAI